MGTFLLPEATYRWRIMQFAVLPWFGGSVLGWDRWGKRSGALAIWQAKH